jgi:hypothetical protein
LFIKSVQVFIGKNKGCKYNLICRVVVEQLPARPCSKIWCRQHCWSSSAHPADQSCWVPPSWLGSPPEPRRELERLGDGCEPEQDLAHATTTGHREARALGARCRESLG